MNQALPAFHATACAYVQLFRLLSFLHPNRFSPEQLPEVLAFIKAAAEAMMIELLTQEKAAVGKNKFVKQLLYARQKLVQMKDILYGYRRQLGGDHAYAPAYRKCSHLLEQLQREIKERFGDARMGKLKLEDQELAQLKPAFLRRTRTAMSQMKCKGMPTAWAEGWYQPMAASVAGRDNTTLTRSRVQYLFQVLEAVEQQLQAGTMTEEALLQLLLKYNFNCEWFEGVYRTQLLNEAEAQQNIRQKINLLELLYNRLEMTQDVYSKGLLPEAGNIRKRLKSWITLQIRFYDSQLLSLTEEPGEEGCRSKRIALGVSVPLLACFCKVFHQLGFFKDKDLSFVLNVIREYCCIAKKEIPGARSLIVQASSVSEKCLMSWLSYYIVL